MERVCVSAQPLRTLTTVLTVFGISSCSNVVGPYDTNVPVNARKNDMSGNDNHTRKGQSKWYELVHVKRRKLSPPRMPLALSTRMSRIWYHADRREQWKRVTGWHSQFCCSAPRTGASGETCPDRPQAFKKVNNCHRRFRRKTAFFFFPIFSWTSRL